MQILNKLTTLGMLVILLVVSFSCETEKKKENTVIKGIVDGAAGKTALIINENPFNPTTDTVRFDESGTFVLNLDIKTPKYYTIELGRTHMVLFIRPGDSLIFNAKSGSIFNTVVYSGDAAVYNDYIIKMTKTSGNYQSRLFDIFSKDEVTVTKSIDSLRAVHADEIALMQKNSSDLDPFFLKMEKARIIYEWALYHRIYPDYYTYLNKGESAVISPEFDTYLAETSLNDEELIDLPIYLKFLEAYLRTEFSEFAKPEIKEEFKSHITYELSVIDKNIENKKLKSILVYNTVNQQVKYDGIKDYDLYWDSFVELCNNDTFINRIKDKLKDWEYLKKGMPAKDFSYESIDGKKISLSSFKGKWVYIDIWATWCNPCIGEIPKLKELETKFHGKNIVFMSISVDRTQEPWKKMVAENEMKGVQLWAGQDPIIIDFYRVNGIPRFMIIDPETNIYEVSADRPTMGVETTLDKLLAQ